MIPYSTALRDQLAGNLARHTRREHPLDGRRHAAVAIVVVDSDFERDAHDPYPVAAHELSHFCLHRDLLLKNERLPASKFLQCERFSIKDDKKRGQELLMELEADLFAAYLITKR